MSFISAADILKAVQIGYQIYQKFYVRSNQADARYLEFLKDVRQLSSHLQRLAEVFEKAGDHQTIGPSPQVIQARQAQSLDLIGDFASTLEECRKLLVENQKAARGTVASSARWYVSGCEARSQSLKTKVLFHCTKISFIVEPLKLELLQKISKDVVILQQQIQALRQLVDGSAASNELPEIPSELVRRYEHSALNERPFQSSEPYPLRDSINALLYNFSQCTVNASSYHQPSAEQFNSLLKARWILDKVVQNSAYKRLGPCLSRSVVLSVKEKIEFEFNRFEDGWIAVELSSIETLEPDCFSIWFEENPKPLSPSAAEEDIGELRILDLPLRTAPGDAEQNLLVFRQTETEYRLLQMTYGEPGVKQMLNTHTFICVPLYAVPGTTDSHNSISVCHNNINRPELLNMQTKEDILNLQQAFTNFKVMNNCASIEWTLSRQKLHHKAMKGSGKSGIQIWHPETLDRASNAAAATAADPSNSESSSSRRASTFTDDLVGRLQNKPGSIISVPQGSSNSAVDGVIASMRPKIPALMMFTHLPTKHGDAPSFVYIPMNQGFHINKYRCGCADPASNCRDIILEMNPGKRNKFTAKIHRALDNRNEPSLQDWNLFIFADPKPKAYSSLETIDDAVELHLRFDNVKERKIFTIWLFRTLELMDSATSEFNRVRSQMRVLEHRLHTNTNRAPGNRSGSVASQVGGLLSPQSSNQPHVRRASSVSSGSSTLPGRGASPAELSTTGSLTPPQAYPSSPPLDRLNKQFSYNSIGSPFETGSSATTPQGYPSSPPPDRLNHQMSYSSFDGPFEAPILLTPTEAHPSSPWLDPWSQQMSYSSLDGPFEAPALQSPIEAHPSSPPLDQLTHQVSHSSISSASQAATPRSPRHGLFHRSSNASTAGPSATPATPAQSILRRASSKTIVASPSSSMADHAPYHFPGSRSGLGLSRIIDEDEEDHDQPKKDHDINYLHAQWPIPPGMKVARTRADSGASLSPLSGSPETQSAMKRAAAGNSLSHGSPGAGLEDQDSFAVADGYAPLSMRGQQGGDAASPRKVATWMRLVDDHSQLSRAMHKQRSIEGEEGLGIMGNRQVA